MQQVGLLSYFAEQRSTPLAVNDNRNINGQDTVNVFFKFRTADRLYLSCPSLTGLLLRLAILDL